MSKLSEMLDYGYIIAADDDLGCAITWNGSATFNFWVESLSGWTNTDVQTHYEITTLNQAEKIAQEWLANPNGYDVCEPCGNPTDPDEWIHGYCVDCHDWRKCDDCYREKEKEVI